MEKSAIRFLHRLKPELSHESVGLSFNSGEHIIYTNDVVYKQLGYSKPEDVCFLHPFMLSPELQPDGELSSTKATFMLKKARVLGEFDFPWVHVKADKTEINCHIHLFDVSDHQDRVNQDIDIFTIWQFQHN